MKSKQLTLFLNLVVVFALSLGILLPCVIADTTNVAYAAAGNYYASITATKGTALLGQLHDLIVETHTTYTSYDDCKGSNVQKTDPGPDGGVMEFYTQKSIMKFSGTVGTWNREHVWCQSLSGGLWGTSGGGSDMHHIRPSEAKLNSSRGNKKYGEVGSGAQEEWSYNTNGGKVALGGHSSGSTFEPLDNVKGDVARIVMYVYTHYNNASNVGGTKESGKSHGNLPITNVISASNADAAWQILLRWNKLDPVDNIERARNEAVYAIQHNRNPFIDNENYADAIWGNGTVHDVELESLTLTPNTFSLTIGATQALGVTPYPSNANAAVNWTSSDTSVATVNSNGIVTAVGGGTATITATSVSNSSISASAAVTVKSLTGIQLVGEPNRMVFDVGESFVPLGLTVKLTYSDGSSESYDSAQDLAKFTWTDASSGSDKIGEDTTKIKCTYGNLSVVSDWSVTVKRVTAIELIGTPNVLTYQAGQSFNPLGLTVKLYYNNNSFREFISAEDLKAFVWVDADTDSEILLQTTTKIKVKYQDFSQVGEWTVTVSAPSETIGDFVNSVAAIQSETTLQGRFNAIKTALSEYDKLSSTDKAKEGAIGAYQILQQAIADYNEEVTKQNSVMESATKTGAYAVCGVTLAALALIAVLNRKFS